MAKTTVPAIFSCTLFQTVAQKIQHNRDPRVAFLYMLSCVCVLVCICVRNKYIWPCITCISITKSNYIIHFASDIKHNCKRRVRLLFFYISLVIRSFSYPIFLHNCYFVKISLIFFSHFAGTEN